VRLWVDDKLLLENWTGHGPTDNTGTIALEAGKAYAIKLEYFESGGPGTIRLRWTPPGLPPEILDETRVTCDPLAVGE
jgi:hypothetical protein